MKPVKFVKAVSLPTVYEPNTIYFIPDAIDDTLFELYVSSDDGLSIKYNSSTQAPSLISVRNQTGVPIQKGVPIYISGSSGNKPLIIKANANTEQTSSKTFGFVHSTINDHQNGYVVTEGVLAGLNTQGLTEGVAIWLGSNGEHFTQVKPNAPIHAVFLGMVIRAHQTQGSILVKIQNGFELEELHNVATLDAVQGDTIVYNATTELWENKPMGSIWVQNSW